MVDVIINTDTRNPISSLILDTTTTGNQTVACILLSGEAGTFECEFCYSAGYSCLNLTCIPATTTPTLLPNLTELTYCYRATASVNGIAIAVIQDTFNICIILCSCEWYVMHVYINLSPCLQFVLQLH